jgi:hypothetical protein
MTIQMIESGNQIKIVVTVNRNAAILAGQTKYGDHVVALDPGVLTPDQRYCLTQCGLDYERKFPRVECEGVRVPDASLESIIQLKAEGKARDEARLVERRQEYVANTQKFLALSNEEALNQAMGMFEGLYDSWWTWSSTTNNLLSSYGLKLEELPTYPEVQAKRAVLETVISERNQRLLAAERSRRAAREYQTKRDQADKAAKLQAQKDQIIEWVKQYGNENQQARMAAGVLPDAEIQNEIRNWMFQPLTRYGRYSRMTNQDVCVCCDYTCPVEFEVETADTMTAQQWTQAEEMKALLPNCTVQLRIHEGVAKDCGERELRYSYLVTVEAGAFAFSREYEAPATPEQDDED